MAAEQQTVAFLGIGTMGHGMASSALRAGLSTVVWNRSVEATQDLAARGAQVASSPTDAVARADLVVTMVTDADAVLSLAVEQGVLHALAPGAVWVQMSTIGVGGIERVVSLVDAERSDVVLVDAPVSGSKEPAEAGQLTIFASGPDEARPRVGPLFEALGQRTVWVGRAGAGTRLKLVNNTLLAFTAEGLSSSVALAHRFGFSSATLIDALGSGPLISPWEAAKLQRIAGDDYSAQFALALALKDVHLALEAVDPGQFEAFAGLAHEWERAAGGGLGGEDVTVMARALEEQRGGS